MYASPTPIFAPLVCALLTLGDIGWIFKLSKKHFLNLDFPSLSVTRLFFLVAITSAVQMSELSAIFCKQFFLVLHKVVFLCSGGFSPTSQLGHCSAISLSGTISSSRGALPECSSAVHVSLRAHLHLCLTGSEEALCCLHSTCFSL